MRIISRFLVIAALLATQQVFAETVMQDNDTLNAEPCSVIAKACSDAGYVREQSDTKGIWKNCMEPIILGQAVADVTVDAAVAKACRTYKIGEMQMKLKQMQEIN